MPANVKRLTDRQRQVLLFIQDSVEERGYPPTLREIGAAVGIASTNGVDDHVQALRRKGWLEKVDPKAAIQCRNLVVLWRVVPLFVEVVVAGERRVVLA